MLDHLLELLEEGSSKLPGVTRRKMFGCEALFANANIYALVWKEGRIDTLSGWVKRAHAFALDAKKTR